MIGDASPYPLTAEFLAAMKAHWFDRTVSLEELIEQGEVTPADFIEGSGPVARMRRAFWRKMPEWSKESGDH